jgi:hypothetical protein
VRVLPKQGEEHLRWLADPERPTSVDDLFAYGFIHLEQMNTGYYWLGITVNGVTYHIDLHSKRRIEAFARELPAAQERK